MKKNDILFIVLISILSLFNISSISKERCDFDNACKSIGFQYRSDHIIIIDEKQRKTGGYVRFLKDTKNGNYFILKQGKKNSEKRQFDILSEALGSYIAKSINLPTQIVIIVPANYLNTIKKHPHYPASIHTFVPGIDVKKSSYNTINLKATSHKLEVSCCFY